MSTCIIRSCSSATDTTGSATASIHRPSFNAKKVRQGALISLGICHQPNWAFNSDANTGQGQYWCPPRFALRRRLALALGQKTKQPCQAKLHVPLRQSLLLMAYWLRFSLVCFCGSGTIGEPI